jgi:hypothetical protein
VAQQALGHHAPALGVVEDAGVLLDAGVEDHRAHHLHRALDEGRRGQHQAVGGGQPFMHGRHAALGLLGRGRAAEDGPDLRVEVDLALRVVLRAVDRAILGDGPDEPVAVPAYALDIGVQPLAVRQRPARLLWLAQPLGDLGVDGQPQPQLKGHEEALAVVAQHQAVVPVGRQAAGQVVTSFALQVERQRAAQVAEDGILPGRRRAAPRSRSRSRPSRPRRPARR